MLLAHGFEHPQPQAGDKLCIVMSDTRPFASINDSTKLTELPLHQLGVYHNLAYAVRHGYDFRRVQAIAKEGYNPTWPKMSVLLSLLNENKYDMLVYLDGDAYITNTSVPLSVIFNVAHFTSQHSVMLARDPPREANMNRFGDVNVNTGFIVVRNDTASRQVLKAVLDCPETIAECEHLKRDWPHEQGALNNFVVPFLAESTLLQASCDLFNGFAGDYYCKGRFVSHAWTGKNELHLMLVEDMARMTLDFLAIVLANVAR